MGKKQQLKIFALVLKECITVCTPAEIITKYKTYMLKVVNHFNFTSITCYSILLKLTISFFSLFSIELLVLFITPGHYVLD